uniref:Uncharacterized protein n=1 Tax=Micrurus carvalhoi TaxID=3147026 RepID=A0A2H6N223_9SAUR
MIIHHCKPWDGAARKYPPSEFSLERGWHINIQATEATNISWNGTDRMVNIGSTLTIAAKPTAAKSSPSAVSNIEPGLSSRNSSSIFPVQPSPSLWPSSRPAPSS